MSARYGSRTRSGEAVSGFGQRGAGGGTTEVTASFSPAPAASVSPQTIDGIEYQVASVTASTTVTFVAPATAQAEVIWVGGGGNGGNADQRPPTYPGTYTSGGGGGGGAVIQQSVALTGGPFPLVIGGATSATSGFSVTAPAGGNGAYAPWYGGTYTGGPGGSGGGGSATSSYAGGYGTAGGTGITSPLVYGNDGYAGTKPNPTAFIDQFRRGGGGGGAGGAAYLMNGGAGKYLYFGTIGNWYGSGGWGTAQTPPLIPGAPWPLPLSSTNAGVGAYPAPTAIPGGNATANTGGGGGGAMSGTTSPATGGSGGSGVMLICWQRFQG